jgi:hypothetical protein
MRYFLIRDDLDTNHVIAIHRALDAAVACFAAYVVSGDYEDHLELIEINTNERGTVISDAVVLSFSKRLRSVMCERADILHLISSLPPLHQK